MRHSYSSKILQSILNQYDNLGVVKDHHLFTSGYENSNCYAKTNKGQYVVKIYEGKDIRPENIHFEVEVMDELSHDGVKVPHVLKNSRGELTTDFDGKYAVVMDFLAGENLDRQQASDEIIQQIGNELGKMDTLLQRFSVKEFGSKVRQKYVWDLKNFLLLEDKIELIANLETQGIIKRIIIQYRAIKPTFNTLPSGLIHNDIGLQNILVETKENKLLALIDFSDAAFSPYIQNVAIALCHLCFLYNFKPQQVKLFLQAYQRHHKLSDQELS